MSDLTERLADLERRVQALETRAQVARDPTARRLLDFLRRFAASPFNDGTLTMTLETLSAATCVPQIQTARLLRLLHDALLIEDIAGRWRITLEGSTAFPESCCCNRGVES